MSEDQFQSVCYQWAYNTFPQLRKLLFHVPNGGSRNKIEAIKFKAMGLVPGIPDLLLLWKGTLYSFELKVGSTPQSNEQLTVQALWTKNGAYYYLIRDNLTQFKEIVTDIINHK